MPKLVVLVHGWSVHNTNTYGELAARLGTEAAGDPALDLDVRNIWLSKYVSFHDEVHVEDISRAFEAALRNEVGTLLDAGERVVVITHSTGGPVVRDWWNRFYVEHGETASCPMSHLIMLAPANFGSALAQLGKATVGRIMSWFDGIEPGQGVLDWLELGSPESLALNRTWIAGTESWKSTPPVFPFVLTGQSIDRKAYDHVNSYTGEIGSDGVVRAAAANLNATYVRLVQELPRPSESGQAQLWEAPALTVDVHQRAPETAFAILPGRSHSGETMGILRSIGTATVHPTVSAILRCLRVETAADYEAVRQEFAALTTQTVEAERVERHEHILLKDTYTIHDQRSMVIVRILDDRGHVVDDFDLLLLGQDNSPDRLPPGFFADRQRNTRNRGTLTYFLNHDVMMDGPAIVATDGT
ncbi:MAG TPA: hypothetical protein VLV86_09695, partial [Vicinamibacterales bacterium]|nr:hypothetical protein [Vicinamibacterales bacterium]